MKKRGAHFSRRLHIPVMPELRREFGLALHGALAAAELGHFNKTQFDKLGACLNCILGALVLNPPKDPAMQTVIEGAARAMNQCGTRGTLLGIWTLTGRERISIIAGVKKAEETLQHLGVMDLYESMQQIKTMKEVAA